MLEISSFKNIKRGHKLEVTYLYACWIMHMRRWPLANYQNGMPKVARKAFIIGEDWNPVDFHCNKTVKLVLWNIFSRILLQRIKRF